MRSAVRVRRRGVGLRQTMAGLHVWVGLLAGWLLYAMFLTGSVSFFRSEITQWMHPEVPFTQHVRDNGDVANKVVGTLATLASGSPQWSIDLPDARDANAYASWRGGQVDGQVQPDGKAVFDPATGQALPVRDTWGGEFFYYFHFTLHYLPSPLGRWIVGLAAMALLVALVSGVIIHKKIFANFFTFRPRKGQVSWLDAHNAFSVLGLPFHFMIAYTGLVALMTLYVPWGSAIVFDTARDKQAFMTQLHASMPTQPPSGQGIALANVGDMVRQAETRWGAGNIARVVLNNPGDASARVLVVRGETDRVSVSPQSLLFDGASGALLQASDPVGMAAELRSVFYALHLGRFADVVTRFLYFIVSLAGTAMVGTGLVLWAVKRRSRAESTGGSSTGPHTKPASRPSLVATKPVPLGLRVVERLNIASVAGLSIAMSAFLWGNRLLPVDMTQRAAWEIHLFFIVWLLALGHAMLRPVAKAWFEQWCTAAVLLALLPVLNALTSERNLFASIRSGDWVFAGVDLTVLALAGLHAVLAVRSWR